MFFYWVPVCVKKLRFENESESESVREREGRIVLFIVMDNQRFFFVFFGGVGITFYPFLSDLVLKNILIIHLCLSLRYYL